MTVARNVAIGVAVRFTIFNEPQRVLSSLWNVLLLSMVFVQPYCGMYPQVIFVLDWVMGVVVEFSPFVYVVFFLHLLVSLHKP